jgi:hypothetical protein
MTVFVDYMDKFQEPPEILFIGAKVSDASRPLVRAIFQVTPSHVCSSSTEGFAHCPSKVMGQCGKTVAFKQEHGKKAELPCPDAKQQKNCPLRDLLSKYTNMDNGQREFGGGCQKESTSLSNNTALVRQARHDGDRDVRGKALALMHKKRSNQKLLFNDKKRKNDKNKENEMELIVTYGEEV